MAAVKKLAQELKGFMKEPLDGVVVSAKDEDLFTWQVAMFGPPDTIYSGGYFKAELRFPKDYPFNPPQMRMLSGMYHPNIYPDGRVCISILHPPGEDELSGERPEERWNPTQTVRTIILSVLSLLNEPNIASPANVDASVAYRDWQLKKSKCYEARIRQDVEASRKLAIEEGIDVPETMEDYLNSSMQSRSEMPDIAVADDTSHEVPEDEDYYEDSDMDDLYYEEDDEDNEEN